MKLEYSRQIFEKKNTQILNFMKIRPVFHANRWTDRHNEADSSFSKFFANAQPYLRAANFWMFKILTEIFATIYFSSLV